MNNLEFENRISEPSREGSGKKGLSIEQGAKVFFRLFSQYLSRYE